MQKTKTKNKQNNSLDDPEFENNIDTPEWGSIKNRYGYLFKDQIRREDHILKKSAIGSGSIGLLSLPAIILLTGGFITAIATFATIFIWSFNIFAGYYNHKEDEKFVSLHFVGLLGFVSLFALIGGTFAIQGLAGIPYAIYLAVHGVPLSYLIGYTYSQMKNTDYS